jgi:hypothetical protein
LAQLLLALGAQAVVFAIERGQVAAIFFGIQQVH